MLNIVSQQKALGQYIIELDGSLDTDTHTRLQAEVDKIMKESPQTIVFNMENLDYLSSTGIRVVLKTRNALKDIAGKLVFLNMKPQIKKVFDIINALPSMSVFSSIQELDEYLDTMQKKVTDENG